jgi:uncharacterized protein YjbI with pentapeptide repeats
MTRFDAPHRLEANLQKADLRVANLQNANLWWAKFDSDGLAIAKKNRAVGLEETEEERRAEVKRKQKAKEEAGIDIIRI